MHIGKDTVVGFHYTLKDASGGVLESSDGGEATIYLHGNGSLFPALEKALEGKSAGDSIEETLSPEDTYGQPKADAQARVPKKHLLTKGKLMPGQVVHVNTEHGARQATVVKVGLKTVDIDTNHPLAGQTLTFAITVDSVRAATAEEISHGHVHGHGGCDH